MGKTKKLIAFSTYCYCCIFLEMARTRKQTKNSTAGNAKNIRHTRMHIAYVYEVQRTPNEEM